MGKESTYQKLKRELAETKKQLWEVVLYPGKTESIIIKQSIKLQADIEKAVWHGAVNK